ncbi:MAG: hypothetical protein AB7S38_07045 [Vulcanimicrobiota bacterium]
MSQSAEQTAKTDSVFPGPLRARPEYFVAGRGRYGVYYLIDHLLRSLAWGSDREAMGNLSITVETEGTLKLTRRWPGCQDLYPELEGSLNPPAGVSLAEHHFLRCVNGIKSGKFDRLQWARGNPFTAIYLAVAVALSSRAKLSLTCSQGTFTQTYREGLPAGEVARSSGGEAALSLELLLDSTILQEEIPSYPFRIRLRELACLLPGINMELQYKGFKPVKFKAENGVRELLEFYVPDTDRLHPDPFLFEYTDKKGLNYRCALFLIQSEMERLKSFAGLDESYHGGTHENVFRDVVLGVFRQLHKFEVPERRQSLENIASSRMTYFGTFGATIPYNLEERKSEFVRTVPGVAAAIHFDSPGLEWESNHRARALKPELDEDFRSELLFEFRRWVLEQSDTIRAWKEQWAPKGRRKRSPTGTTPAEKKDEEEEDDDDA